MNDMSAALQIPVRMSLGEFLAWNPEDGRTWQLVDGEPQAMAPPGRTHALIQAEVAGLLRDHFLRSQRACFVMTDPGVRPQVLATSNFRIPDVAVTCTPSLEEGPFSEPPVVLVEILSVSNERETWANVWAYTTIPSVQEILCVRTASIAVELLRRRPDGSWPETPQKIETGPLHLASIDFTCDVSALYRTTHLARP